MELANLQKFYLGANSSEGFINKFTNLVNDLNIYTFIIKGGPGTGKSTFMKTVAMHFMSLGNEVILFPCSSDPDSLDGILILDKRIAIIDGTSPHTVDPIYLGINSEIINVGSLVDNERLLHKRAEIIGLYKANKEFHKKAGRYISAAGDMLKANYNASNKHLDLPKTERTAMRYAKKYLKHGNGNGKNFECFLSGITPKGFVFYKSSIDSYFDNVIGIYDEYGSFSDKFLKAIKNYAVERDYDVITVLNPVNPSQKIDHILIPEISVSFSTVNSFNNVPYITKAILQKRYYKDFTEIDINKLKFSNSMSTELIKLASNTLKSAKSVHDDIEKEYIGSMDFKSFDSFTSDFLERLENF